MWLVLGIVAAVISTRGSSEPEREPEPEMTRPVMAVPKAGSTEGIDTAARSFPFQSPSKDTTTERARHPVQPAPQAPRTKAESSLPAKEEEKEEVKDVTVYVTRTGDHYHRSGCSSLRKSRYAMNLSEARNSYEPCHRCHPPR